MDVVSKAAAGAGTQPDRTEARIRESAREFESVFLSFLLKTMRRTVPQGETPALGGGNRVYQEMMDEELARTMAKGRGVGLADILVRDLTRKNTQVSRQNGRWPTGTSPGTPAGAQQ